MTKRELSRKMSELGRAGAAARTKKLSPKRRKEIATNAAKARWAKQCTDVINYQDKGYR